MKSEQQARYIRSFADHCKNNHEKDIRLSTFFSFQPLEFGPYMLYKARAAEVMDTSIIMNDNSFLWDIELVIPSLGMADVLDIIVEIPYLQLFYTTRDILPEVSHNILM